MTKQFGAALAASFLLAGIAPCWATDDSATLLPMIDEQLTTKGVLAKTDEKRDLADANGSQAPSTSPPASTTPSVPGPKASLPKKVVSVASAIVIGTPVCMVRRTKYEEKYAIHGQLGDTDSKVKKAIFGTLWFPFAVVDGFAEAPFDAFANGIMYPAFSKDQMSEGKLKQNN